MKKILLSLALISTWSFGHSALMSCFDNGDETITCEGGFSDGSSASGVYFIIEQDKKEIFETRMNENSEVTFKKPNGDFTVILDAGEGHEVYIESDDID